MFARPHACFARRGIERHRGIQPQVRFADGVAHVLGVLAVDHGLVVLGGLHLAVGEGLGEIHDDGAVLHRGLHVRHRVETAGVERGEQAAHLGGVRQSVGGRLHQLAFELVRQLLKLPPSLLALKGAEGFEHPLVQGILVHAAILSVNFQRISMLSLIVWEHVRKIA